MSSDQRPPTTPQAWERRMVAAAMTLAEKQLNDGTASAQVITHYLKLGSSREQLEQERLANENTLLQAKADALASQQRVEELYEQAISAMRAYSGHSPEAGDYDD